MKYECDIDGLKNDFVEFSDSWSRREVRAAWDAVKVDAKGDAPLMDALRPKIIALHLTCVGFSPIVKPEQLTDDQLETVDTRAYQWFSNVWVKHLAELAELGNAAGRRLWDTSDSATKKPQPAARQRK